MVRNLIFLAMAMFTVGCNTFQIAGLLPQIGQTIGQPVAITGQGITIFSVAYLISAPLFSVIFANKPIKTIIQLALGVFILGNLITVLSKHIALFLIGRSLAGAGAGMFIPLCITLAFHLVKASAKGRVLSFVWGANSAGVVLGIPIGLYLSSLFHWQISIAYIMALSLVALIGFSLQKTDIRLPESEPVKNKLSLFVDKKTISIIGISCVTALASLGLFSYIATIQSGSANSLTLTLFSWGLGGFVGSSFVGFFIDKTGKPQLIMALILAGLMLTIISIPFTQHLPYLGLIPFFMWGALGWATTNPQQHILFELHETKGAILVALNSSAFGLGAALGTALGGLIINSGLEEIYLPFSAAALLLVVLIGQLLLIKNSNNRSIIHE
jgi:predicted MFS family arabinose efflux permease